MVTTPEPNPWSAGPDWNLSAQGAYIRRYGMVAAEARAREAGTKIGALRPREKRYAPLVFIQKRFIGATGGSGGGGGGGGSTKKSISATILLEAGETIEGVAGTAAEITYTLFGDESIGSTDSFKKLAQGQLPISAGILYTTPSLTTTLVKSMHLADAGAGASGIKLFVGGTASSNAITGSLSISPGGFAVYTDAGWQFFNASGQLLGTIGAGGETDRTYDFFLS